MDRKLAAIIFSFVLIGISGVVLEVQRIGASEDIHIKPDGSVEPLSAPIQRDGDVYTFTDNIYDSLHIGRDNIIVDGNGYTLQGSGAGTGITFYGKNVTLQNLNVNSFSYGINFYSNYNVSLFKNNITNNGFGIALSLSSNITISRNNIANNSDGIRLGISSNNNVSGNNITANSDDGVYIETSSNNTLTGNRIANNYVGITLEYSPSNNISRNYIMANEHWGIDLSLGCPNNTLFRNNITNNGYGIGVFYASSSFNKICQNNITRNNADGIYLESSSNNTISGNNITNNGYGISIAGVRPGLGTNNTLFENNIAYNSYGIRLTSSNNRIYHNNIVDNIQQVYVLPGVVNSWDDGAGKGNYWSDYEERYPDATEIDGSGVWDTPYVIDANNQDIYPIVPEFPIFLILPLLIIATLLATILHRRKHSAALI